MVSYFQALILGILQGVTELFPISSLGHSVILPTLFGWRVDQHDPYFLLFLVATHLATALVLFVFFFSDWKLIIKGLWHSLQARKIEPIDTYAKLGWLIVVGSIPAGILGLLLEEKLKNLFAFPQFAAGFLVLNGFLLWGAELLRRKTKSQFAHNDSQLAELSWMQSIQVGIAQCLALIRGFSRTGSTIDGGLLVGLTNENVALFSFLLATPIIFAASLLKLPELLVLPHAHAIGPIIVGSIAAAIAAYFSVQFLEKYFKTKTLTPFAIYCGVIGITAFLIFSVR